MTFPPASNVLGIGLDIIEIERLRRVLERWADRFVHRVFCESEQTYCARSRSPWRHYAGRFAVKEAVSKAFGTGIGAHVKWKDIEIVRARGSGAPAVCLHGAARDLADRKGVANVLISLAHGHAYAVGQAVLIGPGPGLDGGGP